MIRSHTPREPTEARDGHCYLQDTRKSSGTLIFYPSAGPIPPHHSSFLLRVLGGVVLLDASSSERIEPPRPLRLPPRTPSTGDYSSKAGIYLRRLTTFNMTPLEWDQSLIAE